MFTPLNKYSEKESTKPTISAEAAEFITALRSENGTFSDFLKAENPKGLKEYLQGYQVTICHAYNAIMADAKENKDYQSIFKKQRNIYHNAQNKMKKDEPSNYSNGVYDAYSNLDAGFANVVERMAIIELRNLHKRQNQQNGQKLTGRGGR